jgi:hypothetical protein
MKNYPDFNKILAEAKAESYAQGYEQCKIDSIKASKASISALQPPNRTRIVLNKPTAKKAAATSKTTKVSPAKAKAEDAAPKVFKFSESEAINFKNRIPKFNTGSTTQLVFNTLSAQPGLKRKQVLKVVRGVNKSASVQSVDVALSALVRQHKLFQRNAEGGYIPVTK